MAWDWARTLRGMRPYPAVMVDKLELKEAAEERRARMAEEKEFRRVDKEGRMKEGIAEMDRS